MINELIDNQLPGESRPVLICVLGMHRSGTSAVTSFVHALGAFMGAQRLEAIPAINADGFWEDGAIVGLNEELLAAGGRSWSDHRAWQSEGVDADLLQRFRARALAHMRTHYLHQRLAVIKDPRLCRLLPFWLEVWDTAGFAVRCLYVVRHPYAVASSLHKRDKIPLEYSVLLWLQYMLEAAAASVEVPAIVVSFDALLEQPARLPAALIGELDIALPMAEENWHNAASLSLDAELRHGHDAVASAIAPIAWVNSALAVYNFFCSADFKKINRECLHAVLAEYRLLLADNNECITPLQRITGELMQLSAEAVRVGELHTNALMTISQKETEVAHLQKSVEDLQEYVEYLQKCVDARNQLVDDLTHFRIWRLVPRILHRMNKK